MKTVLIILILIASSECGLLKGLLDSEDQPKDQNNLLNQKPKNTSEPKTEYHQGVLIKVVETLKNGTKVVVDALGNIIHINPDKNNEETSKTKSAIESTTKSSLKDAEVVKKDETSKSTEPKTDTANPEKVKDETASKIADQTPKLDENKNNTVPTEANKEIKDPTSNVNGADAKNTTEIAKIDSQKAGNECPKGKNRADDGTCVEEE